MKKKFNELLWQDYSLSALLQQKIYAPSKYYFESMDLTSTSVRVPWFQLSLRSTKWIVRMIQLERNSIKQRAIQHAFKWNKFQFSPTTDAQRTVKWALWFYITLSSPFSYPLISSTLLWLKLLWPQLFIFVWLCLCFLSCDSLILHTHCMTQQTAPRDVCVDQIGRWPMVMEVDN